MKLLNRKNASGIGLILNFLLLFCQGSLAFSVQKVSPEERFIFDEAKRFLEEDHLAEGISSLELFYSNHPESPLAPDVLIELGIAYTDQKDLGKAVGSFRLFLEKFPKHNEINAVRYKLASVYLQMGSVPGEHQKNIENALLVWKNVTGEEAFKIPIYTRASEIYIDREEYINALRVFVQKKAMVLNLTEQVQMNSTIIAIIRNRLSTKELQTVSDEFSPRFPSDEATMQLIKTHDKNGIYYLEEKEGKRFLSLFPNHVYAPEVERLLDAVREKTKEKDYLIGVILPLSGKLEQFGMSALHGIELALKQFEAEFPQSGVGLVIRDRVESEAAIEAWLDDYSPIGIVGPLLSKEVSLVAPVAERGRLSVITPGATATDLPLMGVSVFRNATTPASQCRAIAEYALSQSDLKRFAILFQDDSGGKEWVRCFRSNVESAGNKVVFTQSYPPNGTDFKDAIERLKKFYQSLPDTGAASGKKEGGRFDSLFLPGDAKRVGLILPQLVFHGLKNIPLLGTMGWNDADFLKLVRNYAEGAVFVDGFFQESPHPLIRNFVKEYKEQFQEDPNLFSAQAYDSANMILGAIRQGAKTPSKVTAAIAQTEGMDGISGFISEMQEGEAIKKPFLIQVQKGRLVQVN
ncbi:MAG: ABC transporter substrate-binding protein [Nitrospirota bacterium]